MNIDLRKALLLALLVSNHGIEPAQNRDDYFDYYQGGNRFLGVENLNAAILSGDIGKVRTLIKKGIDVNSLDRYGKTPLEYAMEFSVPRDCVGESNEYNEIAIVELLVQAGADVNKTIKIDKHRGTPLELALEGGEMRLIRLFVKAGARVNKEVGAVDIDSLEKAVQLADALCQHDIDSIDSLLASGARIVHVSEEVLHHASFDQHSLRVLLRQWTQLPFAGGLKALKAINKYWEHLEIFLVDCLGTYMNGENQQKIFNALKEIEKKQQKTGSLNAKRALKRYSDRLRYIENLIESRKKALSEARY